MNVWSRRVTEYPACSDETENSLLRQLAPAPNNNRYTRARKEINGEPWRKLAHDFATNFSPPAASPSGHLPVIPPRQVRPHRGRPSGRQNRRGRHNPAQREPSRRHAKPAGPVKFPAAPSRRPATHAVPRLFRYGGSTLRHVWPENGRIPPKTVMAIARTHGLTYLWGPWTACLVR